MFGTIRRHQTWLWAIIITGTILSFLVWFSPDARWGGGHRNQPNYGKIDGHPVTMQEFMEARQETRLLYFLNFQQWPDNDERARQMGFDVDNETYMRLLRVAKTRESKIQVSDETVGQLAQRLLGPKTPVANFVRQVLEPHGLTEVDLERFLRHDAAIQQLGAVAGLSGRLIPPRELEEAYREEHEEVALDAVLFNVSNYLASVSTTDAALQQWYSNNTVLFHVPEKARVSYVEFNRSNFLAEVDKKFSEMTNFNQLIDQEYMQMDPTSFKDEAGKVLAKDAAIEKLKNTRRLQNAQLLAARKANDFASQLYDEKDHTLAGFEKFAKAHTYQTKVSEPFDETDGPTELKVSESFARTAFALTNKEEAISIQPTEGESGFYIFALKEILPGSDPAFAAVREKVTERYRLSEAQRTVRMTGYQVQSRLTNTIAQGKTFAQAATEANVKAISLPAFSRSTRELADLPAGVSLAQIRNLAFSLQSGKVGPFIPTMDGGFILFLRAKLPIDPAKMKTEFADYAGNVRMQRQNEAFGLWFRKQAEHADLPVNRETAPKTPTKRPASSPARPPR